MYGFLLTRPDGPRLAGPEYALLAGSNWPWRTCTDGPLTGPLPAGPSPNEEIPFRGERVRWLECVSDPIPSIITLTKWGTFNSPQQSGCRPLRPEQSRDADAIARTISFRSSGRLTTKSIQCYVIYKSRDEQYPAVKVLFLFMNSNFDICHDI